MNKQERLFTAIGGADEALLARSENSRPRKKSGVWLRWCAAAAACLAVAIGCVLVFHSAPSDTVPADNDPVDVLPPPDEGEDIAPPDQVVPIEDSGVGQLHTVKLAAAAEKAGDGAPDFYLFVDSEGYVSFQEDGAYIVRARNLPDPELGLPVCELRISHTPDTSLDAEEEALRAALAQSYPQISDAQESSPERRYFSAQGGTDWNSPVCDLWLVDDGQGGVFTLAADYFLEAAEGHGVRFADMASTFRVVDSATPQWLTQLRETAEEVARGVLSDRLDLVADLLTGDADMSGYGEDVLGDVSIGGFDFTPDDPQDPASAVVSIRLNLLEDSADYLTIEFRREDGQWLACWSGIEK